MTNTKALYNNWKHPPAFNFNNINFVLPLISAIFVFKYGDNIFLRFLQEEEDEEDTVNVYAPENMDKIIEVMEDIR